MYSDLLNLEFSSHRKVIAFADDLAIMTYGKTPKEAEAFANSDTSKIERWAKEIKMQFNEAKAKAMLITRKRCNKLINVYLNNKKLEEVEEMKYLGIYFDSRLTFDKHIQYTAENSTKLIYMLGRSAKFYWGLGYKALKTIYEGALIPLLRYGAPVWDEAVLKERNLRMPQRTQRLINIKTAKAFRTISFEASCMMAGVQPLGIVIEENARMYEIKHNTGWYEHECDTPLPLKEWPHPTRQLNIPETSASILYSTKIYTDGSKIGGKVGAGVAIYVDQVLNKQCKYKLQNHCSNNQAEQIAILKSLDELPPILDHNARTVAIYTDSKVTLDSLRNNFIHSPLIENIRHKVRQLMAQNWTIHFGRVKAHTGIEGNEKADKLAKEAAEEEDETTIAYNRVPITTVASGLKEEGLAKWQKQWGSTDKGALF
jgi:ribonuclease HI